MNFKYVAWTWRHMNTFSNSDAPVWCYFYQSTFTISQNNKGTWYIYFVLQPDSFLQPMPNGNKLMISKSKILDENSVRKFMNHYINKTKKIRKSKLLRHFIPKNPHSLLFFLLSWSKRLQLGNEHKTFYIERA